MGLKPPPHASVKGALRAKRMMLGDPTDEANPFHWDRLRLNMPSGEDYDPTFPWIAKIRSDGRLAAAIHQYVDDLRLTAPDKELAWRVSSKVVKICSWLGLQDAARKRREPSQTPGAWAGAVVSTENGVVTKYITQERWEKSQTRLKWLGFYAGCAVREEEVDFSLLKELKIAKPSAGKLSHKIAEKYRGFLVYISRTYRALVPYLKGLHLTLDFWRADCDEYGWRVSNTVDARLEVASEREKPPKYI
jgi:hypothetical protein